MTYKFSPLLDSRLQIVSFLGVHATAPTATDGDQYINSGDNGLYIYYSGAWNLLHTLTPPVASFLLMESGDTLLLESGDKILLE